MHSVLFFLLLCCSCWRLTCFLFFFRARNCSLMEDWSWEGNLGCPGIRKTTRVSPRFLWLKDKVTRGELKITTRRTEDQLNSQIASRSRFQQVGWILGLKSRKERSAKQKEHVVLGGQNASRSPQFGRSTRYVCALRNFGVNLRVSSDLKTIGGNCDISFHQSSKTVEMFAASPPQHEVFVLLCCTLPASFALVLSVLSNRVISS